MRISATQLGCLAIVFYDMLSTHDSLSEKNFLVLLSHLCTPNQSLHKVSLLVRLSVSESYKTCWMHLPYWTIQQVLQLKHIDA